MSWRVVKLVMDAAPVKDKALVLMLALAEWSQDDGVSWHDLEEIAARARCTVRWTREMLARLAAPDESGHVLLEMRRGKRATFYQINIPLLERLRSESAGQQRLFPEVEKPRKSCGIAVENPVEDCANPTQETELHDVESVAEFRKKDGQCISTINNQKNQKEPEQPKPEPAAAATLDHPERVVVTVENLSTMGRGEDLGPVDVRVIVNRLANGKGFPPDSCLSDAGYETRRRFLERQGIALKWKVGGT